MCIILTNNKLFFCLYLIPFSKFFRSLSAAENENVVKEEIIEEEEEEPQGPQLRHHLGVASPPEPMVDVRYIPTSYVKQNLIFIFNLDVLYFLLDILKQNCYSLTGLTFQKLWHQI